MSDNLQALNTTVDVFKYLSGHDNSDWHYEYNETIGALYEVLDGRKYCMCSTDKKTADKIFRIIEGVLTTAAILMEERDINEKCED